jgi:polyhydroxybutyrate depolymerase
MSHLNTWADAAGVITVAPQGTGGTFAGWNVGSSPMGYLYDKVDDVAFFGAMIDELEKTLCIDPRRIYCAGFSLGGSMCYRLSCDLSQRIAAIASVSGPDGTVTCSPQRPVPLLHIHGTADTFATYKPSSYNGSNKGAEYYVANHAKRSGCTPQTQVTLTKGKVSCKSYGCPDKVEVTLCTVQDGGHTWPGGDGWLLGGTVNKDINASKMILEFFHKHPLP